MKYSKTLLLFLACIGLTITACAQRRQRFPNKTAPSTVTTSDVSLLKNTLLAKGIRFGTMIPPADFLHRNNVPADFNDKVAQYFNFYTLPLSWALSENKGRGMFTFDYADKYVEFAIAHNAKVKGHTLVFGNTVPKWLSTGNYSPDELQAILKNHIQTLVRHFKDKYPGAVTEWNVVNEPVCNDGHLGADECLDHSIEKCIWTAIHKPGSTDPTDYIQLAFQWAHEADPSCKLYLNETNIEMDGHPKVERAVALIKYLQSKGTPIDGIGIQAHLRSYNKNKYTSQGFTNIINRFADLGLQVQVSEFDVMITRGFERKAGAPSTIPQPLFRVQANDYDEQAQLYATILRGCLNARNFVAFTTWGAYDAGSWTSNHFQGKFYPNLLDDKLQPKPAFKALVNEVKKRN